MTVTMWPCDDWIGGNQIIEGKTQNISICAASNSVTTKSGTNKKALILILTNGKVKTPKQAKQ